MTAKILIVDDEPLLEYLIQQKFRQKIRAKEFEFVFAKNGIEAMEKLFANSQVDLVMTDINMPEMDGLTLLNEIASVDKTIKTIVVTAYGDLQNIRTAMNRGAFDFLTKPIDFDDMHITMQRALEVVKQLRENLAQLQQTQTQLIQNEKMASIGQLVAGVAHEINNPVGFILGNIEQAEVYFHDLINILNLYQKFCREELPAIKAEIEAVDLPFIINDLPQLLSSMKEGTERICQISTSLRTFSRGDTTFKVAFNIHEGIDSTLMILRHRLKATDSRPEIQVIKDYGVLPLVDCYPGQLNQVFMNIIANAIDALEVLNAKQTSAQVEEQNPPQIIVRTLVSEDKTKIEIHIADNGMGMTQEIQQRVFEHLFTTKTVGKGTGLGLSISRQIVEEKHGGKLSFSSSLDAGTEFIIQIPVY